MPDVNFCPHCGEPDPLTQFNEDIFHNKYKYYTDVRCPDCDAKIRVYRMGLWDGDDVEPQNENDVREEMRGDFFTGPTPQRE